jgi:hypothetical protein
VRLDRLPVTRLGAGAAAVLAAGAMWAAAGPASASVMAVHKYGTRTAVSARPGTTAAGDWVTLSARVASARADPGGSVAFWTGRARLCTARVSRGSGWCRARLDNAGVFTVSGRYSGDGSHWGSTGYTRVRVDRWNTGTRVTASPASAVTGQAVRLSAVVTSGGPLAPGGTVTFRDSSGFLCSARVSRNAAACPYAWRSGGSYEVTGAYSGDGAHNASSGTARVTVTVPEPRVYATATAITNPDPATTLAGEPIAIHVAVTSDAPGAPPATGTVSVAPVDTDGPLPSSYYCQVTLTPADRGVASCDVTPGTGTWGYIHYEATYAGDSRHTGSVSAGDHTVIVPETTTTTVSYAPAVPAAGQPETLTAAVVNEAKGSLDPAFPPAGTVSFYVNGTVVAGCAAQQVTFEAAAGANDATCSWTPAAAGSYQLTAVYSGDDLNLTSTSPGVTVTVP